MFVCVYLAAMSRDNPDVSRDPVSSLHFNQISGHHFFSVDLYLLTLTDHQCLLRGDMGNGWKTHAQRKMVSCSREAKSFSIPSCENNHLTEHMVCKEFMKWIWNQNTHRMHDYLQAESGNHQLCHLLWQYAVFTHDISGEQRDKVWRLTWTMSLLCHINWVFTEWAIISGDCKFFFFPKFPDIHGL